MLKEIKKLARTEANWPKVVSIGTTAGGHTAVFRTITKQEDGSIKADDPTTGGCHANLRYSRCYGVGSRKNRVAIQSLISSAVTAEGEEHPNIPSKTVKAFFKWLFNESHVSHVFIRKSVPLSMEEGALVTAFVPDGELLHALILSRFIGEFKDNDLWMGVFTGLLDEGVSMGCAIALSSIVTSNYILGRTYLTIGGYASSHSAFNFLGMSKESYRSLNNGVIYNKKEGPLHPDSSGFTGCFALFDKKANEVAINIGKAALDHCLGVFGIVVEKGAWNTSHKMKEGMKQPSVEEYIKEFVKYLAKWHFETIK